jgi:hypothetical protein
VTDISFGSNSGVPGEWIFRIDDEDIISACPKKGSEASCENNKLCSCLTNDPEQNCQCTNTNNAVCKEGSDPSGTVCGGAFDPPTQGDTSLTPDDDGPNIAAICAGVIISTISVVAVVILIIAIISYVIKVEVNKIVIAIIIYVQKGGGEVKKDSVCM